MIPHNIYADTNGRVRRFDTHNDQTGTSLTYSYTNAVTTTTLSFPAPDPNPNVQPLPLPRGYSAPEHPGMKAVGWYYSTYTTGIIITYEPIHKMTARDLRAALKKAFGKSASTPKPVYGKVRDKGRRSIEGNGVEKKTPQMVHRMRNMSRCT